MILKDKVAIITGGSRGIGKGIATLFAEEGCKIVIVSKTKEEIKNTLKEIEQNKKNVIGFVCDISKWIDIENAISETIKRFSTVDILVNNAGIQAPIGPFIEINIEEWKNNFKVNFFGTAMFCKAVLPIMIETKKGKIINFSGGGATSPRINFSAYGTAKTAIVRFTETLAEEIKEFNIQVNAIAPGPINTRMLTEILEAGKLAGIKELKDAKRRKEKGGETIEKAAELALFLASDKSGKLSGKLLSAQWDDWVNIEKDLRKISNSSLCTLRRIDGKGFIKVN